MTLKQTERLLQLLAKYKVYHYKTDHLELHRENDGLHPIPPTSPSEAVPGNTVQRPLGDIAPSISTIPHEENRVASLLKLSDEALVDALFPDHTNEPHE